MHQAQNRTQYPRNNQHYRNRPNIRRRRRRRQTLNSRAYTFLFVVSLSFFMIFNLSSSFFENHHPIEKKSIRIESTSLVYKFLAQEPKSYDIFPNFYANTPPLSTYSPDKTVYLTFDDGPSERTLEILDILDSYSIKATFFVSWQQSQQSRSYYIDYLSEILDRGHEIGIHTYTHDYTEIYASTEACLSDLNSIFNFVFEHTGYRASIMRFAGGSYNSYNKEIYSEITKAVSDRGFVYYDWNCSFEDASNTNYTSKELVNNATKHLQTNGHTIVLAHDSRNEHETVNALPLFIDYALSNGFSFEKLDKSVAPIRF